MSVNFYGLSVYEYNDECHGIKCYDMSFTIPTHIAKTLITVIFIPKFDIVVNCSKVTNHTSSAIGYPLFSSGTSLLKDRGASDLLITSIKQHPLSSML